MSLISLRAEGDLGNFGVAENECIQGAFAFYTNIYIKGIPGVPGFFCKKKSSKFLPAHKILKLYTMNEWMISLGINEFIRMKHNGWNAFDFCYFIMVGW